MSGPVGAAVYFEPDGYDTSRRRLMGRHVAGESFLSAVARFASAGELVGVGPTARHAEDFAARVRDASQGRRAARWIASTNVDALAELGCLFYPGLPPAHWAWVRRRGGQRRFSLCGVTHTTASERAMAALCATLSAPFQTWDAVVCTSRAVHAMVERLLDGYSEFLLERCGGRAIPRPQLPVIPLGVDCQALEPDADARERGRLLRQRIGIAGDTVVALFVGRLSYHGKAHPLPLYLALERARRATGGPLCLLLSGWFANDAIREQFVAGARRYCPSVQLVAVDGRRPEARVDVWHAADLFVSPSDNVQETFGLAPIEAMAAGLPCVISDWDGYRDGVREGEEGFLVPTWLAPPGSGEALAERQQLGIDDYDRFIGRVSQFSAVEVEPMQRALETLIANPDLRRDMGERARRRARLEYDWPVVIARYEALWSELAARRSADRESAAVAVEAAPAPLHPDPFDVFRGYPSQRFGLATRVRLAPGADPGQLEERLGLPMNTLAGPLLCGRDGLERLLGDLAASGERPLAQLLAGRPAAAHPALQRSLVWLAKLDLVRLRAPDDST